MRPRCRPRRRPRIWNFSRVGAGVRGRPPSCCLLLTRLAVGLSDVLPHSCLSWPLCPVLALVLRLIAWLAGSRVVAWCRVRAQTFTPSGNIAALGNFSAEALKVADNQAWSWYVALTGCLPAAVGLLRGARPPASASSLAATSPSPHLPGCVADHS